MLLQMNAGAKVRPKTETSNAIQQRIDTLNERFTNNEITLTELLDGLEQSSYSRKLHIPASCKAIKLIIIQFRNS